MFPVSREKDLTVSSDSSVEEVEEKTEVIYGIESITKRTLERLAATKATIDSCFDALHPSTTMNTKPIVDAIIDLKKRRIKARIITEITKHNLHYCREFLEVATEVRHLDDVKGNFSISDGVTYQAMAVGNFLIPSKVPPSILSSELDHTSQEARQSTQCIFTTVRGFVDQQQYFFEMLWKKAIPASQRIKEIEENLKREFIETIRDTDETTSLISKVLSSATEEILIIFSRANTLKQYEKLGMLHVVRNKADKEVEVRMLIGTDKPINDRDVEWSRDYPRIELRYLNKSIQTSLTTIVTDRDLSLVIEEKEEENDIDLGLATYSNSESTVLSCASIFENLWVQSTSQSP